MLRIFKTYNFKLGNPGVKNNIVSYSARPGDLESKDDFYVLGQSFAVIESSLNNYNKTMYSFIQKEALPVWIRVNIANRFASSSKEWVDLFTMYNSGTHNNQWAIVDYELYWSYILQEVPQEDWKDLVWLVEQFFFIADKMDVTQEYLVRDNYFATYNFPYHKEIFDLGNYSINNPHDQREDIIRFNLFAIFVYFNILGINKEMCTPLMMLKN